MRQHAPKRRISRGVSEQVGERSIELITVGPGEMLSTAHRYRRIDVAAVAIDVRKAARDVVIEGVSGVASFAKMDGRIRKCMRGRHDVVDARVVIEGLGCDDARVAACCHAGVWVSRINPVTCKTSRDPPAPLRLHDSKEPRRFKAREAQRIDGGSRRTCG